MTYPKWRCILSNVMNVGSIHLHHLDICKTWLFWFSRLPDDLTWRFYWIISWKQNWTLSSTCHPPQTSWYRSSTSSTKPWPWPTRSHQWTSWPILTRYVGCYSVVFSCSPSSTEHIYTNETCVALANLWQNWIENRTSCNVVMQLIAKACLFILKLYTYYCMWSN